MKLRRFKLENVRSFLQPAELLLDGEISILIGPNGGGKTNLLDAISLTLRRHLLTSWMLRPEATTDRPGRHIFQSNDIVNSTRLDRHSGGAGKEQRIEVEVEVTSRDVQNIAAMKEAAVELTEVAKKYWYEGGPIGVAANWDIGTIKVGDRFTYTIENDQLQQPSDSAQIFQQYLSAYEVDRTLRAAAGMSPLATPLLSLPVNRAGDGFQSSVTLAGYNEFDAKKTVDAATSRQGSSIGQLAVGRLATKYRILLEKDSGQAKAQFDADPQVNALTLMLRKLGYEWALESVDPLKNRYDVRLTKQGSSFLVVAASSGEKELLTYLFAVYALNVRDALIVVDEPELHLHPKWQSILLQLFEELARDTGNQFLLATHSPVFVSPASIQYVSRVYSELQQSRIVRLKSSALPLGKHLFSTVNSQNNERIFFADRVVLVEGVSDRIFLEKVFEHLRRGTSASLIYEVVSVGGKMQFGAYGKLLDACAVPHMIVADLDYVFQVGTPEMKALFEVDHKAIREKVIDDAASLDGQALVRRLDEAVTNGTLDDLKPLWEYIKSRKRRPRSTLSYNEKQTLEAFIRSKRQEGIYILSLGDLESYLPLGYRSKDLDKLIALVHEPTFWETLSSEARCELSEISNGIESMPSGPRGTDHPE